MIKAKGMAAMSATTPLVPYTFERRDPKENDVVINIKYCGICHSDIHVVRSEWWESAYPMVPGHEIAGIVTQVGSKVTKYKVGDKVGIGCFVDSCRTCINCKDELNNYCVEGPTWTYSSMERDGSGATQGGYSDVIVANEDYVLRIPDNIPLDKAAPLLCAGITLYSPLSHWKAGPNKKVGIIGMGGLGHIGVKIAAAMGADVYVLSHSNKKRDDALKMGAKDFIVTTEKGVLEKYASFFDLIINTVSSADIDMNSYFTLLKRESTLVALGIPNKPYSISPVNLIFMRRNYSGSSIGSIKETQEMLDFCSKHNITPEIEVINPSEINTAYERILKSDVRYRFVIDINKI